MRRCWCSSSNGRRHVPSDRHVMFAGFSIQRQCIHFGVDRFYADRISAPHKAASRQFSLAVSDDLNEEQP